VAMATAHLRRLAGGPADGEVLQGLLYDENDGQKHGKRVRRWPLLYVSINSRQPGVNTHTQYDSHRLNERETNEREAHTSLTRCSRLFPFSPRTGWAWASSLSIDEWHKGHHTQTQAHEEGRRK